MRHPNNNLLDDLVSVIIPAYNAEEHVCRCINSVLNQSCRPREIIVIDDGSTDRTSHLCREYGDAIQLIQQRNGGVSHARNAGISKAIGRYIAFLDSDDEWDRSLIRALVSKLEKHPEVSAATSFRHLIHGAERTVFPDADAIPSDGIYDLFDLFGKGPSIVDANSGMYRTSLIRKTGGFSNWMKQGEDTEFFIRLSLQTEWYICRQPLTYRYMDIPGQATENLDFDARMRAAYTARFSRAFGIKEPHLFWIRQWKRARYRRLAASPERFRKYRHFLYDFMLTTLKKSRNWHFLICGLLAVLQFKADSRWVKIAVYLIINQLHPTPVTERKSKQP